MISRWNFLAAPLLAWIAMNAAHAGDSVSASLYLAENDPPPSTALLAPEKLEVRLHSVFGYKHYELLKSDTINLKNHWEQWFVPRKDLFLKVEPLKPTDDEPRVVNFEIYKDGFLVANGQYEPDSDTPLMVKGPDFKQGRLIIVLEAR